MIAYDVRCPFCGKRIVVRETTNRQQQEAGLVYLATRCVDCDARIDAAGIGESGAKVAMDARIRERINTRPERWKIKPRGRTRRRGRTR